MSKEHPASRPTYNQVTKIAARFGGLANLTRMLGVSRFTAYCWNLGRRCDGIFPRTVALKIQQLAREEGILLAPEDWIPERIIYEDDESRLPELSLADFLSQ